MKKQLAFYIGWDVIFVLMMYVDTLINSVIREAYFRFEPNGIFYSWVFVGLFMIIGVWISLLMFMGRKFELTRKSAICEFILVGIPAFYLATYFVMPMSLARIVGWEYFRYLYSFSWILNNPLPITAGSILLGYEIFIFAVRMINIKQTKIKTDSTEPLDEV